MPTVVTIFCAAILFSVFSISVMALFVGFLPGGEKLTIKGWLLSFLTTLLSSVGLFYISF
jgi:hypothetical protein